MFWKMEISEESAALLRFNEVIADCLCAVAEQPGGTLDRNAILRRCPQHGKWFLSEMDKNTKIGRKLREGVERLLALDEPRRAAFRKALLHDAAFDVFSASDDDSLQTPGLPKEEQTLLKLCYSALYDVCFDCQTASADSPCAVTNADLKAAFYRTNPHLKYTCPVCLNGEGSMERESELEHYFKKSGYPALMLHPHNLHRTCKACNQTYKGQRDVIAGKKGDISEVFLPYRDTVKEKTTLDIDRSRKQDRLTLRPADPAEENLEAKIKNFDRVFQLEQRWTEKLECIYNQLRVEFSSCAGNREKLRRKMENACVKGKSLSELPECFIRETYKKWILTHQFEAFYQSLNKK